MKSKRTRPTLNYQGRTRDTVKRMAEGGGQYDSYIKSQYPLFKLKGESQHIRILPPTWEDSEDFCIPIAVHYGIGPDEASYLCSAKMNQGECPICDERARAASRGDDAYAYELSPTQRFLFWIIDRNSEDDGPLLWAAPKTFVNNLNAICEDKRTKEIIQIDHPDEGYDVYFERKGKGLKTKYEGFVIERDPSPIHDDVEQQDEWIAFILDNPVPNALQFYPEEHVAKVFAGSINARAKQEQGEAGDEAEDGVETTRPTSSRRALRQTLRPPKPAAVAEEEEEGEEEEEDVVVEDEPVVDEGDDEEEEAVVSAPEPRKSRGIERLRNRARR